MSSASKAEVTQRVPQPHGAPWSATIDLDGLVPEVQNVIAAEVWNA
jgi:hypothetical protein